MLQTPPTTLSSSVHPQLTIFSDSACKGDAVQLMASAQSGDSLRWFDQPAGGVQLSGGSSFTTPSLSQNTIYYVEAVRRDFVYRDALSTTYNSNIDWNGAMFDLVADSTLVIDSLGTKITSLGPQVLEIYVRQGSHRGFENNSTAWTHLGSFSVNVLSDQLPTVVALPPTTIAAGDTLGVYVHLQNSSARLGYQSLSQSLVRQGSAMKIITGSGHTFGSVFYPRDWNGSAWYHYGYKPDGDCVSNRVPVTAYVGGPEVDIGNDTILDVNTSIALDAGSGMSQYAWSTGGTAQTEIVDGAALGMGIYTIGVEVTDALGCTATDSIIIVFAPLAGLHETASTDLLWPNPSSGNVNLRLPLGQWQLIVMDSYGRQVHQQHVESSSGTLGVELHFLAPGVYHIQLVNAARSMVKSHRWLKH